MPILPLVWNSISFLKIRAVQLNKDYPQSLKQKNYNNRESIFKYRALDLPKLRLCCIISYLIVVNIEQMKIQINSAKLKCI